MTENAVIADPNPSNLKSVRRVDFSKRLDFPEIIAACDVENPLLGPQGATAVFSGQKGATDRDKVLLESALTHLVAISDGHASAITPGAGAAGGLGFGLLHFAEARLVPGFDLLASLLDLESRVRAADQVLTGEGSLDHQSLSGKGPVALARMAKLLGKPVTCFCGKTDQAARDSRLFEDIHALADSGLPMETLIQQAAPLLTGLVAKSIS